MLLAHGRDTGHGNYNIAGVCSRCYQNTFHSAVDAAAALHNPWLNEHVECTHGVHFFMPDDPRFQGRTVHEVIAFIVDGAPFHHQIYADPPPAAPDPDAGQGRLDFDTLLRNLGRDADDAPNADEPPAYDPPCPADLPAND